jgi:hypothetical protein
MHNQSGYSSEHGRYGELLSATLEPWHIQNPTQTKAKVCFNQANEPAAKVQDC